MVDKNIIQSRFTKLGVVPIDNQHYLYATLDNNLIGIIVLIKTCDNHYYDEDNIEIGKPINARVTVNHVVELTCEEKEEARKQAIERVQREAYQKMTQRKPTTKKENNNTNVQMTLF